MAKKSSKVKKQSSADRAATIRRNHYKKFIYILNGNCMDHAVSNGHPQLTTTDVSKILDSKNIWSVVFFLFYKDDKGEEHHHSEIRRWTEPYVRTEVASANLKRLDEMVDEWLEVNVENDWECISTGYMMVPHPDVDLEPSIDAAITHFKSAGAWDNMICRLADHRRDEIRKAAGLDDAGMMSDLFKGKTIRTSVSMASK